MAGEPLGVPADLGPGVGGGEGGRDHLPGFGHSDGREELIAPDAMGAFLARLIDEWGLDAPHVVGPDVGTAAALFLAAKAPDRITSLTIGGGAVRFPIDAGGALKDIIAAPSLDAVRELDARTNIGFAVEPVAGVESEPDVHEDYVSASTSGALPSPLASSGTTRRESGAGRSAAIDRHADPDHRRARRRPRAVVEQPVPRRPLANSEIHPLGAGHFAWEQAADEYGRLVVEWVTGGFQRVGRAVTA